MKGIQHRNYQAYRAKNPRPLARADMASTPPEVDDVYTLAPLQLDGLSLASVAGVETARLTEVKTRHDEENGDVNVAQGQDLLAAHPKRDKPRFARGTFVGATFLVTYRSGGPPRDLEIRPPIVALYDRDSDGDDEPTKEFLRANGFVTGKGSEPR